MKKARITIQRAYGRDQHFEGGQSKTITLPGYEFLNKMFEREGELFINLELLNWKVLRVEYPVE